MRGHDQAMDKHDDEGLMLDAARDAAIGAWRTWTLKSEWYLECVGEKSALDMFCNLNEADMLDLFKLSVDRLTLNDIYGTDEGGT